MILASRAISSGTSACDVVFSLHVCVFMYGGDGEVCVSGGLLCNLYSDGRVIIMSLLGGERYDVGGGDG